MAHIQIVAEQLSAINDFVSGSRDPVLIAGYGVNVASVVAVARYQHQPKLDASAAKQARIADAVAVVQKLAASDHSQYGVTTGFGGSATTRTRQTALLQQSLLAHCRAGILPQITEGKELTRAEHDLMFPESWVRAVMLVRLNSLVRGQSGTRFVVINNLAKLIEHNIAPCVPLRQSISASGDLGPLSYISSVLIGHEDVYVWYGEGEGRKLYSSATVLKKIGIEPVQLIAKEGLSLINGTGAACGVATLAIHDANLVGVAAQVCTALAVEVLKGFQEPFNDYLHAQTRPHPGQIEVAANIRRVLLPSKIASPTHVESDPEMKLRQDRYPIRASPQWLGPQIEELLSAHRTIEIELNSTTDNPIVEVETEFMHHGANFMAMSVTSAMEKTRLAVHHIAKLMFAQLTDLINHFMNCGLPPNLAVGEPSVDYSLKGVDVAAAAYLSEIAYLANPVSTHVNSAEEHNQSVNSLALVSARYSAEAVKLCRMLLSTHIFSLCQAADLRAMEATFREKFFASLKAETEAHFPSIAVDESFLRPLINRAKLLLNSSTDQDTAGRFDFVSTELCGTLLRLPAFAAANIPTSKIEAWRLAVGKHGYTIHIAVRDSFIPGGAASGGALLGRTRILYDYVRNTLGVRLHWGNVHRDTTTIGTEIAKVFHAWETPEFAAMLVDVLKGDGPLPELKAKNLPPKAPATDNGDAALGYGVGSNGGWVN